MGDLRGLPYEVDSEVQRVPGRRQRDLMIADDPAALGRMAARRASYVTLLAEQMAQAQREAVAEAYGWGLSVAEISAASGIRQPTVRRLIREAGVEGLRGQPGNVLGCIARAHREAPPRRDGWRKAIDRRSRTPRR